MRLYVLLSVIAVSLAGRLADDFVPHEFIIGVDTDVEEASFTSLLNSEFGVEVKNVWDFNHVKLYHLYGEEAQVEKLSVRSEVRYWERNGMAYAQQTCSSQTAAGCWGLDRIDQSEPLTNTAPLSPDHMYIWGERLGEDVNVYVCDSGIDISHVEFGGRASWGYTAEGIPAGEYDSNGHGTHCAGTVGSDSYGVAKGANLIAVKVLRDSGSAPWTSVVDGMNWVMNTHMPGDKSVISMSLGGSGIEQSIIDAVTALTDDGVNVVVAAGNSNGDACNYSPAAAESAITVGASDVFDATAGFTNWGTCVDIFAPGVDVLSTIPGNMTDVYDGTSMATPHTAGVVARYLETQTVAPLPSNVASWLKSVATRDALTWSGNNHDTSPNFLLFANC